MTDDAVYSWPPVPTGQMQHRSRAGQLPHSPEVREGHARQGDQASQLHPEGNKRSKCSQLDGQVARGRPILQDLWNQLRDPEPSVGT